jgi:hypothetical protein
MHASSYRDTHDTPVLPSSAAHAEAGNGAAPAPVPAPTWLPCLRAGLVLAAVLGFGAYCIGLPVQAASLAVSSTSSAVDSLSTSVGTFSGAVSAVSTSSSSGRGKVAQGEYRIEAAQDLPGLPARVALALQPTASAVDAGAQPWQLRLPAQVAASVELRPGAVLEVRERPYGLALWQAGADQAFYLVVQDEWWQAMQVRAVDGR